ncbi:hypothetical protein MMC22_011935 [Lobaria immixta]|nr:hypothetical protein [Lobaria immixta]
MSPGVYNTVSPAELEAGVTRPSIPLEEFPPSSTHSSNAPSRPLRSVGQRWTASDILPVTSDERASVTVERLESYPPGYPRTACFLDSDPAFMVYRRFGTVSARLLLNKQDELRELEQLLNVMDNQSAKTSEGLSALSSRELDEHENFGKKQTRTQLLKVMEQRYLEYSHLLAHAKQNAAISKPKISEYTSLQNFLNNYKPLVRSEMEWIQNRDDLVTLRPGRPPSHLEAFLGRAIQTMGFRSFKYLFVNQRSHMKTSDPSIRYYSRKRVERAATILLIPIMLSFIVVPIWMLTVTFRWTHLGYAIAIITVSNLLFCSMLSIFTKARRHEVLGAGAAYCAVLVVFMSNIR